MSNEFLTTDADLIYDEVITMLESGVSEPLYPGDERKIFGEALVPLFVSMYNAVNDAARQKSLRHARGDVLDALGERVGVTRIAPTEATTVLRFSMISPVDENVIIPEGTRATSDNTRYFATTNAAVIEVGALYVDVEAVSVGGGSEFNDIPIGAINALVDMTAYIDTVSNIEVTAGGGDEEDDDSLRERIRVAPSKLSTAGPVNSYKYWAMSADESIIDVTVKSEQEKISRTLPVYDWHAFIGGGDLLPETLVVVNPANPTEKAVEGVEYKATYEDDLLTIELLLGGGIEGAEMLQIEIERTNAGVVKIVPVCKNGEEPSQKILDKVLAACSASEVRPLTDRVVVEQPYAQPYDIEVTYYTTAAEESACIQTVEGEGGAIDQYIEWQAGALGRHINPDKLRALILAPSGEEAVGASRVVITSPEFTELNDTTIAQFSGAKTIRHEVIK